MNGFLQFDVTFFASFLVLVVMSCIALVFSMFFYLKSRAVRKLPKNLSVSIFNKTFNVFDPYPDRRKVIHSFITLFPIFVMAGALILVFVVMTTVFEMGLVLSLILSVICINLIVLDEAFDVYKYAGIFTKAIKNGVPLGRGDLAAFYLVKETIPKLRVYYLSLAIIFIVSSITLPYLVPALLSSFAQIFLIFEFTASAGTLTPYFITLLFAIVIVIVQIVVKKVKRKIVGFL